MTAPLSMINTRAPQKLGWTTHLTRDRPTPTTIKPNNDTPKRKNTLRAPISTSIKETMIKEALYGTQERGTAAALTNNRRALKWSAPLSCTANSQTPLGTTKSENLSNDHKQDVSRPSNKHMTKKDPPTNIAKVAISCRDQRNKNQLYIRDQENQPRGPFRLSYRGRHPLSTSISAPRAPKPSKPLSHGNLRTKSYPHQ